ncbi:MAG: hypothetical protein M3Q34_04235 [bacterium]|nr:hypothetical protein [bacterium]
MDTLLCFPKIASRIIKEQETVIGPLAWNEAKKVEGLSILDQSRELVSFSGDPKETINRLVARYERIFGKASHAVCHDAVQDILAEMPRDMIPSSLA